MRRRIRRAVVLCSSLLVGCLTGVTLAPAHAAVPLRLAVTFDSATSPEWLHTNQAIGDPDRLTGVVLGTVTRATWTGGNLLIPADVASVPGVVTDPADSQSGKVGVFPQHNAGGLTTTGAFVVRPVKTNGIPDTLAPRTGSFVFGADVKLDTGVTARDLAGTPPSNDNGNNVVQRGLSANDQYKMQVDIGPAGPVASCYIRETGTPTVSAQLPITAGTWLRLRCQRSIVSTLGQAHDQVVLTVTTPNGTLVGTKTEVGTLAPANLDFSMATPTKPIPFTVGAKVNGDGSTLVTSNSDQFNGRIDNVYLAIG
jgi:hypothetical protein